MDSDEEDAGDDGRPMFVPMSREKVDDSESEGKQDNKKIKEK